MSGILFSAVDDTRRLLNRLFFGSEVIVWLIIAGLIGYPALSEFITLLAAGNPFLSSLAKSADVAPWSIIAGGLTLLFPILVAQIFGAPPLALLRASFNRLRQFKLHGVELDLSEAEVEAASLTKAQVTEARQALAADPRASLAIYAERTSELTQKIYGRSGVYLLVGVIISFVGLGFFWVRTRELPPVANNYIEHFLNLMPGIGILFFIEFVAFFFLRLHRASMDEFRYFDAIRRSREESLIILKMFAENPTPVPTKDVLTAMNIYSTAGKIGKDETTEMLEARRLQRDESVVFEKLIDTLGDTIGALKDLRREKKEK
jgi:hypothetical protein